MLKRPFVLVYFCLVALAYCIFNYYVPVFEVLYRLGTFNSGDIAASILYFLQFAFKLVATPYGVGFLFAALLGVSALAGLIFSGYFVVVNNTLDRKPKIKGEFVQGIRKYFMRISLMTFIALLFGILFGTFCMIASVPALVVSKAAFGDKPGLVFPAVLIDIVTAVVLYLGMLFFRMYFSFWYPAALNYGKKAFSIGKKRADACFGALVGRFILFDLVFIIFQSVFIYADKFMGDDIVLFIGKWIFLTLFYSIMIVYFFALFKITSNGGKD